MTIQPETFNPITDDLRPTFPEGKTLSSNEYTVAVILHQTPDDGIVRVVFPQWLSKKVVALTDVERKVAYDVITTKIFEGLNALLSPKG